MSGKDRVGRVVVVKWGIGHERGLGYAISYMDEPTYGIELVDGQRIHWVESLVSDASPEQEAEFWRKRARHLERELANARRALEKSG